MNAIKNITIGHTKRLCRPVGLTVLANLINIVPFCLSIEAVRIVLIRSMEVASHLTRFVCGIYSE